jgi:hypothetical protein
MARIKQQLEEAMVEIGGDGLDGSGSDRPAPEEQALAQVSLLGNWRSKHAQ